MFSVLTAASLFLLLVTLMLNFCLEAMFKKKTKQVIRSPSCYHRFYLIGMEKILLLCTIPHISVVSC